MKKRIRFIINPFSGIGKQKSAEKLINEKLDLSKFEFDTRYTKAAKHATELSREAQKEGIDIVVAVGGDGSVNEVARGLIGSNTAMGILPAGSGNGLARHLKIPMNLANALEVINTNSGFTIDTFNINEEVFVGIAGVGFDAHIGWKFANYGKRGFSSYVKIILNEFSKYCCQEYELEIDGKKIKRNAFLISFANGSQYGNNAYIAPKAILTDGLVDICIMRRFPLHVIPHMVYRLFNRTMDECSFLETLQGANVTIRQENTIAHIDGESVELGKVINIRANPLSLKVIAPLLS
jgi:diacylglycerol kinase (ATP)